MKYFISLLLFFLTVTVHSEEQPVVKIQTNFGIIVIELNPQKAPRTVENFLRYVQVYTTSDPENETDTPSTERQISPW